MDERGAEVSDRVMGAAVIDEMIFPISRMWLSGGLIHLQAQVGGPTAGRSQGETDVRLIGPDGIPVGEFRMFVGSWPQTYDGDIVEVDVTIRPLFEEMMRNEEKSL
jgi:hypothetical protein